MLAATRAEIHPEALTHNLARVREFAPEARVMAVVKANAYGHGAETALAALGTADALGVATTSEALDIRRLGYAGRICVMSRLATRADIDAAVSAHLWPVIHDQVHLDWIEAANGVEGLSVWLKVDTGMHRLGFRPREVAAARERLERRGCRVSLMTHLANADDVTSPFTDQQLTVFNDVGVATATRRSAANSAGIVGSTASHYDWVRPGIMLYGASPVTGRSASDLGLRPAMTLSAPVIALRRHRAGESSGYAQTWTATADTTLAAIGIGYADGYSRHVAGGTPVLINGVRYPIVGRISMDTIMVDVGSHSPVRVGDRAVLWGEGLPVDEIASAAGTIAYELLSRIGERVPRIVVADASG